MPDYKSALQNKGPLHLEMDMKTGKTSLPKKPAPKKKPGKKKK